jgi:hypothetical protein
VVCASSFMAFPFWKVVQVATKTFGLRAHSFPTFTAHIACIDTANRWHHTKGADLRVIRHTVIAAALGCGPSTGL